jgi:hypothetical protein
MVTDAHLLAILRVAHETSFRGAGLSIRDALAGANYSSLRSTFAPSDLVPLIKRNPELVQDWLLFSGDKRTSGGWYLLESGVIGQVGVHEQARFDTIEDAVAEYVVRELDSWVRVGRERDAWYRSRGAG